MMERLILLLALSGVMTASRKDNSAFIPPQGFDRVGCEVKESSVNSSTDYWWHLVVWASYPDRPTWRKVYRVRPSGERKKIFSECAAWVSAQKRQPDAR